jgi:glycosyltransferase involved in cell wall biosynthesis
MDWHIMKNKNHPTVSVIIPTYNRANLINKAIQSVLDQTYTDFEIIVVDDGSTDNTENVVKGFQDERIRYMYHKKNMGVSSARNTGIISAKGVFISFQDSDDVWLPKKLEKEIKIFESSIPKVGVVYSRLCRISNNEKTLFPLPEHKIREGTIHNQLVKGNFVHGLTLIRKSCFEKVGTFDEQLPALEDWEIYLRISKYFDFRYLDETLIISYLKDEGLTLNLEIQIDATEKIIEKHFDEFNQQKRATADIYGFLASQLCLNGSLGEGRNYFLKAIRNDPINFRYYFAFIVSLLGLTFYKKILLLQIHR